MKRLLLPILFHLAAMLGVNTAAQAQVIYFHNDVLGSPVVATDAGGAVVWKENYQPYGSQLNAQAASSNNKLWFTGKPFDRDTQLSYFGARYYDPAIGRFMGVDPQEVDPNHVHGLNRYAYGNNNPYRFVDPDGNSPIDLAFLVYDLGKLGVAVYSGAGVGAAAADVALSLVGVASPVPGAGQALKMAKIAEKGVEVSRASARAAEQLAANRAAGEAFDLSVAQQLRAQGETIVQQVIVKTESGTRTRLAIVKIGEGGCKGIECKSSATAPLSSAQARAFPEIEKSGATVVGQGKPGLPSSSRLEPQRVEVVRPSD